MAANPINNLGQLLISHADKDTSFDTLKSSADSYLTALDGVLRMVSSTAAANGPVSVSNNTVHAHDVNKAVRTQVRLSSFGLINCFSRAKSY